MFTKTERSVLVAAGFAAALFLAGSLSQALATTGDARVADEKLANAKQSITAIPADATPFDAVISAERQEKAPLIRVAPLVAPHSCATCSSSTG
jgi:hypothetical protein